MPKLVSVKITGLFGHFNHSIKLDHEERITAIIGPNGYGKTISLRLIDSLFSKKFWQIQRVNFKNVTYEFSDSSRIEITKKNGNNIKTQNPRNIDGNKGAMQSDQIIIKVIRKDQREILVNSELPTLNPINIPNIETYIPNLTRISSREWFDRSDESKLDAVDLFDRYGDHLPESFFEKTPLANGEVLDDIFGGVECKLIETQRLLPNNKRSTQNPYIYQHHTQRTTKTTRFAVNQKSDKLRDIIKDTTAEYASLSQKLDRSFPRRVIELNDIEVLKDTLLLEDLEGLEKKRKGLMDLCIIDQEIEPVRLKSGIPDELRRMMTVYNDDMAKKLGKFDNLSSKINLFKNILDGRLAGKKIEIDRREGFRVHSEWDESDIPLDKLSSGEQHQLVLIFELLFEISSNSLILIDEPELSLHISWQKKFIADLISIIKLNDFDVVLATHSPQLVGAWWHLTEELGDVEE